MDNVTLLPENQKIFIIITGVLLLVIVVELVKRRKIMEQYSAIWLLISLTAVCFIWVYPFFYWFTDIIGAGFTTSTILFAGLFALLLLNLQLTVKISEFAFHIKDIIQELTLLSNKIQKINSKIHQLEIQRTDSRSNAVEPK